MSDDVANFSSFLSGTYITALNDCISLIFSAMLMLYFSFKLSMVAVFVTIAHLIISIKFSKVTKDVQQDIRKVASEHISFLKLIFDNLKFFKAYTSEKMNERKYFSILKKMNNLSFKSFYVQYGYFTLMSLASFIGSISILSIGIYEVYNNKLTVGTLLVFDTVSQKFYTVAKNIVSLNVSLQGVMVAFDRIESINNMETEENKTERIELEENAINFKNVSFKYSDTIEKYALKDVSINFKRGEVYAIVGPSASGKTTLINLLLKFFEDKDGEIYIGNKEIRNVNVLDLRRKICVVFQENILFRGSIKDNLVVGNKIDNNRIKEVLDICSINDFIDNCEKNGEVFINENGDNLSGGQKQRISIARGVLRQAEIYIFDEIFSNLDKELEYSVYRNLRETLAGKTQIYITHNIDLIKSTDNIIVMNEGKIDGLGNHVELLNKSEIYRNLVLKGGDSI